MGLLIFYGCLDLFFLVCFGRGGSNGKREGPRILSLFWISDSVGEVEGKGGGKGKKEH